ncbi:pyrroline-5-carboxylate reductase [Auriculariales sp. MPI-PUGE-AT-0066]|nr:pyrroline-5-carboxylate reductase [Auriculariales sp. MPI-PUGE-AT-0066]
MGYTICVLGCGTMGVAILSGVLASLDARSQSFPLSQIPEKWEAHTPGTATPVSQPDGALPSRFIACVNREATAANLRKTFMVLGGRATEVEVVSRKNVESVKEADLVLLCCKPQLAAGIIAESGMRDALGDKLLVSILAGVTISQLQDWVPESTRVLRAMPNTPCKIREGMTVISTFPPALNVSSPNGELIEQTRVSTIFSSIGRCRFLDEKYFDACTALSASGPAFACIFLEAMADGGVMMGLPRAEALELAAQALQGAARMALQPGSHPAQIKDAVTTPGGCTIAGLLALEDGRVRSTIARAIQVATERASVLGQPVKK